MISSGLMIVEQVSHQILIIILNTSLKGLLIIICVYILVSCLKKTNAQTLHLVWFLSIACFIILPVLSLLFQPITIDILRLPENPGKVYQTLTSIASINQAPVGATNSQYSRITFSFHGISLDFLFFYMACWCNSCIFTYI